MAVKLDKKLIIDHYFNDIRKRLVYLKTVNGNK